MSSQTYFVDNQRRTEECPYCCSKIPKDIRVVIDNKVKKKRAKVLFITEREYNMYLEEKIITIQQELVSLTKKFDRLHEKVHAEVLT